MGAPSFAAILATSSSLGGSGNSAPGLRASSGTPGPLPAMVSLIASSLGPVLILARSFMPVTPLPLLPFKAWTLPDVPDPLRRAAGPVRPTGRLIAFVARGRGTAHMQGL